MKSIKDKTNRISESEKFSSNATARDSLNKELESAEQGTVRSFFKAGKRR